METADTESVSSTGPHTQSLEQLLNSPQTKLGMFFCLIMFLFNFTVLSNQYYSKLQMLFFVLSIPIKFLSFSVPFLFKWKTFLQNEGRKKKMA